MDLGPNGDKVSISQDAPEPFEGAHREEPEPEHGEDDVDGPDTEHDEPELGIFDGGEVAQAVAVEEGGAEECVEEVVGQGHASDGCQRYADEPCGCPFRECDDECAVA